MSHQGEMHALSVREEGRKAGLSGKNPCDCPYKSEKSDGGRNWLYEEWMTGFSRGESEKERQLEEEDLRWAKLAKFNDEVL